ncbi:uncharacterized protein G2W53_016310 [Senna tora]|uniref:Uncharacterized protein n=1 Tax=Senna tora TaxID=362788 RepID=A0A834TQA5_9FABA|nr:uncharacterized protein G2W53_016310 [Senna tora]
MKNRTRSLFLSSLRWNNAPLFLSSLSLPLLCLLPLLVVLSSALVEAKVPIEANLSATPLTSLGTQLNSTDLKQTQTSRIAKSIEPSGVLSTAPLLRARRTVDESPSTTTSLIRRSRANSSPTRTAFASRMSTSRENDTRSARATRHLPDELRITQPTHHPAQASTLHQRSPSTNCKQIKFISIQVGKRTNQPLNKRERTVEFVSERQSRPTPEGLDFRAPNQGMENSLFIRTTQGAAIFNLNTPFCKITSNSRVENILSETFIPRFNRVRARSSLLPKPSVLTNSTIDRNTQDTAGNIHREKPPNFLSSPAVVLINQIVHCPVFRKIMAQLLNLPYTESRYPVILHHPRRLPIPNPFRHVTY